MEEEKASGIWGMVWSRHEAGGSLPLPQAPAAVCLILIKHLGVLPQAGLGAPRTGFKLHSHLRCRPECGHA